MEEEEDNNDNENDHNDDDDDSDDSVLWRGFSLPPTRWLDELAAFFFFIRGSYL